LRAKPDTEGESQMLVLTRKVGEAIVVGDDIEITLVRIDDDQVRLGIVAPKDVPVYRKELLEEVEKENLEAAQTQEDARLLEAVKKLKPGESKSVGKSSKKKSSNMEKK